MVASILIHTGARDDLEELWSSQPTAAATIEALLQQLKADPKKLDTLTTQGFGEDRRAPYSILRLIGFQRQDRNIWRLKSWPLELVGLQYRVIYAFDPRNHRHYILGVLHRDIAYDDNHPKVQRMVRAYDRIGIPAYRGSR